MDSTITPTDVQGMVSHWLGTPVNGYLGSSYGQTVSDLLQKPRSTGLANAVITKLKTDVPVLGALPSGSVNIYASDEGVDKKNLFIEVAGKLIDAGTTA